MSNVFKRVELLTNLAIIAVAIVLSVVLIKQFVLTKQTGAVPAAVEISPGEKILLTEVDWSKNGRTLLLVLQKDCHFCTESALFYRRLVKETSDRGDVRLVALLPQPIADGRQYLDQLGVSIADVRQVSPGQVKVHGTPTLILVNENGVVTNVWAGKLESDAESQVLNKL